jgi:predicted glycoside hydrolase/deacetylase ChbG (UPF0249 family)
MIPGLLIVNADDLGVSKGATLGIMKAHRDGIVTSASLAVTTPFYDHAVQSCVRTCPDLGVGLHFTLTSGNPVSSSTDVPLLRDERGFLRWRFTSLLRAAGIQKRADLIHQIDIELEAQLQKLLGDGIQPDHIDGERHVHLIPGIFEKVVAAARRHGIKFVRAGFDAPKRSFSVADLARPEVLGDSAKSSLLSLLSKRARRHIDDNVVNPEYVASYFASRRAQVMIRSVLQRPPSGVTEIMVHPAIPAESAGIDIGNRELERYLLSEDGQREVDFCVAARAWVDQSRLTNFTRLAANMTPQ